MNDQSNVGADSATPAGRKPGSARGRAFQVAALALATVCLVIGAACWLHKGENQADPPPHSQGATDELFYGWGTPEFALVLSAQEYGYLQPCGCSDPQYGGLERRYNFLQSLRLPKGQGGRGWPVVAYDLGDVAQKEAPAKLANTQALIKYRYAMQALRIMGYSAVSFGETEAALPLSAAMDEYALNEQKPPVLAFNLQNKDTLFPDKSRDAPEWGKSYVGSWNVTPVAGVNVGALGIIGTHDPKLVAGLVAAGTLPKGVKIPPSVADQITASEPKTKFMPANAAVPAGLARMKLGKGDFRVLLYQGPKELAKLIPPAAPEFNVILCLDIDEPRGQPEVVKTKTGETWVIGVGHKGKYVGVVGVFKPKKPGDPFEMKYQLVPLGPSLKTPPAEVASQPIIALMERYTRELKRDNYLARYGKFPHPMQAELKRAPAAGLNTSEYVGQNEQTCGKCHSTAFKVWHGSKHAQAYADLAAAKNPSLREFDPECIVCHTVGFRYQSGFANAKDTPKLKDVGCECCHGPCEAHVRRPRDETIRALINPWKANPWHWGVETAKQKKVRQGRIEGMCMECHDHENDVTWVDDPKTGEAAFSKKWKFVEHMTPPDEKKRRNEGGDE